MFRALALMRRRYRRWSILKGNVAVRRRSTSTVFRGLYALLISCLGWAMVASAALGQDTALAVVVHPETVLNEILLKDLRDLYLGNIENIGGMRLKPVMFTVNSPVRTTFEALALRMDSEAFAQHWRSKRFLGSWQKQPTSFKSVKAVKNYISEEKDAIGVVPLSELDSTVRLVRKVDGRDVADPAYALRSKP